MFVLKQMDGQWIGSYKDKKIKNVDWLYKIIYFFWHYIIWFILIPIELYSKKLLYWKYIVWPE